SSCSYSHLFFFYITRPPPRSTLFPYTTLFRSDETLGEVFPDFPDYGKTITVRNLLNHVSGLPDYEDLMAEAEQANGSMWSPEKQDRKSTRLNSVTVRSRMPSSA